MTAIIIYPERGRGAWPNNGVGGTMDTTGTKPGPYYRAPAAGSSMKMIGLAGFRANRDSTEVSVDDYVTWRAVMAYQTFFGATPDGIWGPKTDQTVKEYQSRNNLKVDGVVGPLTSKSIFRRYAERHVDNFAAGNADLKRMVVGHIAYESGFDPAAVGVTTPQDLGLGQINGRYHPDMSVNDRLDPSIAVPWVVNFVKGNLDYFKGNVRDAVASYNLGRGGANNWIKQGRPDVWVNGSGNTVEVKKYVDNVLARGV